MDGPFTCEQLRNIRQNAINHEFNCYTDSIVNNIKQNIIDKAIGDITPPCVPLHKYHPTGLSATQYKVLTSNLQPIRHESFRMSHMFDRKMVIDVVISKLRNVFPDMKILIDHLNTYILFDWTNQK